MTTPTCGPPGGKPGSGTPLAALQVNLENLLHLQSKGERIVYESNFQKSPLTTYF